MQSPQDKLPLDKTSSSKEETLKFADLELDQSVIKALDEAGYKTPTPIQTASLPLLLEGKDLIGIAQTGTGKTAAFALPILSQTDTKSRFTQTLILAPTRELALQVSEAFTRYSKYMDNFRVLPIYGGASYTHQIKALKRGVHVVVGTPGRVMDHIRKGTLNLSNILNVVLDEADEMLRMGFIDDVQWILDQTPERRQIALFSATMPPAIRKVAKTYMRSPEEVKIATKTSTVEKIEQSFWMVRGVNKLDGLTRILDFEAVDAAIIFTRTKKSTEELAEQLSARGLSAEAINGDMNQIVRERVVDKIKKGKTNILVATDVVARGIDIPRISHVINYDVPYDVESYVHRIGRTGRAGRKGKAILFIAPKERRLLRQIEITTKQKIKPMELPSREQIQLKKIDKLVTEISNTCENKKLSEFHTVINTIVEKHGISPHDIAAATLYLNQKDVIIPPASEATPASKVPKKPSTKFRKKKPLDFRPDKRNIKYKKKSRAPGGQRSRPLPVV